MAAFQKIIAYVDERFREPVEELSDLAFTNSLA